MHVRALIAFLNTAHPEKARTFYQGPLGLRLVADEPHALVFDCAGVMLRIAKAPPFTPLPFTVMAFQVDDIAHECKRLLARGINFERYSGFDQDDLGIWRVPDGTQVAWFKDPDGNLLSLTQFAPT